MTRARISSRPDVLPRSRPCVLFLTRFLLRFLLGDDSIAYTPAEAD
jgi:hypothetical protein